MSLPESISEVVKMQITHKPFTKQKKNHIFTCLKLRSNSSNMLT